MAKRVPPKSKPATAKKKLAKPARSAPPAPPASKRGSAKASSAKASKPLRPARKPLAKGRPAKPARGHPARSAKGRPVSKPGRPRREGDFPAPPAHLVGGPSPSARAHAPQPVTKSARQSAAAHTLAIEAARALFDDKCTDIVVLDLRGKSQVSDYAVVASGTSDRQMRSAADSARKKARELGHDVFRSNADDRTTWVVLDCVDVIIHVFEPNARAHYDLESMWEDTPHVPWERTGKPQRPGMSAGAASGESAESTDDDLGESASDAPRAHAADSEESAEVSEFDDLETSDESEIETDDSDSTDDEQ